jgi:ribose transport system permease protein
MTDSPVEVRLEDETSPVPAWSGQVDSHGNPSWTFRLLRALSFRNISAIYVFVLIFVVFSLWVPSTWLHWDTWKSLIDSQAETALLAVALVIPLSAGIFDLAIVPAIILTLVAGVAVGLVNGLLIVRVRIDSFIATLGISSILLAVIDWVSNSQQILGLSNSFQNIGTNQVGSFTIPVYVMLVVALIVWYLLECTPVGRRVYATGGNIEAARLAGIRTGLVIVAALVACGAIAALSGLLESANLGVGDPTIGPAYLLPAFSAAFLGSTQFRGGRFNVWGTVVAVYVLAAGVKGLQLAGAPVWIPNLFDGAALVIAVGLAKYQGNARRTSAIRGVLRMGRSRTNTAAATGGSERL